MQFFMYLTNILVLLFTQKKDLIAHKKMLPSI